MGDIFVLYIILTWTCSLLHDVESCTFPINGTWLTSDSGSLTFTDTTISDYVTTDFGTLTFTCDTRNGDQYMARSTPIQVFGVSFEAYFCLRLTEITENKYTFFIGTEKNVNASDDRLKVVAASNPPNISEVCDRGVFEEGTYSVMIKEGYIEDEKIYCPNELLGRWSYTYENSTGSAICDSSSSCDVCSDNTSLIFDYNQCSQKIMYSVSGNLSCVFSSTSGSGSYKYLHVYNTDSTTDESTTYRYTCLVMTSSGNNMYLTQSPQNCISGQNSTYIASTGASLVFTLSSPCYISPTESSTPDEAKDYTVAIVLGVLIPLVVIILVILIVFFVYMKHEDKITNTKPNPDPKFAYGEIRNRRLNKHDGVIAQDSVEIVDDTKSEATAGIRRESSIVVNLPSTSRPTCESPDDQNVVTEDSEPDHVTETEVDSEEEDTEPITPRTLDVPKMETISEAVTESESITEHVEFKDENETIDEQTPKSKKRKKRKRSRKNRTSTPKPKLKRRKRGSVGDSFHLKKDLSKQEDGSVHSKPGSATKEQASKRLSHRLDNSNKLTVGTSTLILQIKPKKKFMSPRTQKKISDYEAAKDSLGEENKATTYKSKSLSQILNEAEDKIYEAKQRRRTPVLRNPLEIRAEQQEKNGDIKFNFFHRYAEIRKIALQQELQEEEKEKETKPVTDQNQNEVQEEEECYLPVKDQLTTPLPSTKPLATDDTVIKFKLNDN